VTLLRPYKENETYGANFLKPPPKLVEGDELYEVKTILGHRRRGRGHQYYVKWKGYPISEASWKLEQVFSDDGNLLMHYKDATNCDSTSDLLMTHYLVYNVEVEFDECMDCLDEVMDVLVLHWL
jgi:hypothetical protein